ncbi:hypothetical protein LTR60_001420, partial [Cryomyces antarcticus]
MKRLPRAARSVDLLLDISRPTSICRSCRLRAAQQSALSTSAIHRGGPVPSTERIRKRIYGTENPPGQEDPYARNSPLRQTPETREELRALEAEDDTYVQKATPEFSELANMYEPANSWDSLEWVGGEDYVEALKDNGEPYVGFMPEIKVQDNDEIRAALRRAVVEVYTLHYAGREDLTDVCNARHNDDDFESLLDRNYEWLALSIKEPRIKFAIVKRVMQLTGIRLSDYAIQTSLTVEALLQRLTTKPKPKKLAEALHADSRFANLQNVKLFERRVTPIDKEKQVGRWKVIEEALVNRICLLPDTTKSVPVEL